MNLARTLLLPRAQASATVVHREADLLHAEQRLDADREAVGERRRPAWPPSSTPGMKLMRS